MSRRDGVRGDAANRFESTQVMKKNQNSARNVFQHSQGTLYFFLRGEDQGCLERIHAQYGLTFQELRQLSEIARDLEMWGERFEDIWIRGEYETESEMPCRQRKKKLIDKLRGKMRDMKRRPKAYPIDSLKRGPSAAPCLEVVRKNTPETILGACPASTAATLCCNLKTLDAVENCAFECSYCVIKPFYEGKMMIPHLFRKKLANIKLDPNRFYHIGTGQSSDSLAWGNVDGILDDLCDFAAAQPNVLLELKTKSSNTSFFLRRSIPRNIICSWSLNTQAVISHEEHGTADLASRLESARKIADLGIKVAFHFHPILFYERGEGEYRDLAVKVQKLFSEEQIAFISFGSLVFSKRTLQSIRQKGMKSRILQMEMAQGPHGKLTYPDGIRTPLFQTLYGAFAPWHKKVYMYLCMEDAEMWDKVLGWHYKSSKQFEEDFSEKVRRKIVT